MATTVRAAMIHWLSLKESHYPFRWSRREANQAACSVFIETRDLTGLPKEV